jgi:hypothetical protein
MSTVTGINGKSHKSFTKAYRTIVTPPAPATGPTFVPKAGSTAVSEQSRSWLGRAVAWVRNVVSTVVNSFRKAAVVVVNPARKVGRWCHAPFSYAAPKAVKFGRGLRSAFLVTVRVGAVVIGWVVKGGFALFAGVVAMPIAFYAVVRMVMTNDPSFKSALVAS